MIRIPRAAALLMILLTLESMTQLGPRPAEGAGAQSAQRTVRVSVSKEHLTMVMTLPSGHFSRGATIPVTLRLHNSSSGVRVLWVWSCHDPPYGVQVLNRMGRVVYPPATPSHGGLPCTANAAPALPPGRSSSYHVMVVLKGPLIRARIPFGIPEATGDTHEILSTKAIAVGTF